MYTIFIGKYIRFLINHAFSFRKETKQPTAGKTRRRLSLFLIYSFDSVRSLMI